MFKENKDYLTRKILVYIFFLDLFITFAIAISLLIISNNQELANIVSILKLILILGLALVIVFFVFCVVEIVLKNKMNNKIKEFIKNKEFDRGLDYIDKYPKIKILYDIYELRYYYIALLNLYMDNIEKAENSFYSINMYSSFVDTGVLINTTLFLLLIYEENRDVEKKRIITEYFNRNIVAIQKNKHQYNKNASNVIAIKKILDNDLLNLDSILQDKLNIPLIKRILKSNM